MSADGKITIEGIALALNVSKSTVSRTISGKGRIGSETRDRILKYIEEHDYVPNAMAKGLAQSKTYNIGLTVPEDFTLVDLNFFQKCLKGVCECAGAENYDVVVTLAAEDDTMQLEKLVNNRKVDGVLLSRTYTKDMPAELLQRKGVPFVAIGSTDDRRIVQVDHDHVTACKELTELLIEKQVGRLVLLCGNMTHMVSRSRLKGFTEALREQGIELTRDMIRYDADGRDADRIIEEVVAERPGCILCMDDGICTGVLDVITRMGLRIPEDIKVASFYNSKVLERNIPSITSLKFDDKELGRAACRTLLAMLNGEKAPGKTFMGYELLLKESTGKLS